MVSAALQLDGIGTGAAAFEAMQVGPAVQVAGNAGGAGVGRVGQAARALKSDPDVEAELLPMHLSVAGRPVLVVGGGAVATRKVHTCLAAGAEVIVVSPRLGATLAGLARTGRIRWRRRGYRPGDVLGSWLAFAATADPQVNAAVEREAEAQRVFCVRSDLSRPGLPRHGTARTPAIVRGAGVVVGVSSSGSVDPGHARDVRDAIATVLQAIPNGTGRLRR